MLGDGIGVLVKADGLHQHHLQLAVGVQVHHLGPAVIVPAVAAGRALRMLPLGPLPLRTLLGLVINGIILAHFVVWMEKFPDIIEQLHVIPLRLLLFCIVPRAENRRAHPDHVAAAPDGVGEVAAHAH